MAITTILSTEELIVEGPPSSVTVAVDVGPKGERGSQYYTGVGDPNGNSTFYSTSDVPKIGDMYIRRDSGINYGVIYRLVAVPGGSSWQQIIKLQQASFNTSDLILFTTGVGSVVFPLNDFYIDAPIDLNVADILIQATVELDNPAMISVSNKEIKTISTVRSLVTELTCATLDTGTVSLLSGSANVNLSYSLGV